MEEEAEFGLVVAFPDASASFCHGFEAGGLWEKMLRGDAADLSLTTHSDNREVIRRMAESQGWLLETKPTSVEGWDETKLTKAVPARRNPYGFKVVK